MILTPKDRELVESFVGCLNRMRKAEELTMIEVSALADVSINTCRYYFNRKRKHSIMLAPLRIIDALGYEIVIVKRNDRLAISQDPDAIERFNKIKGKEKAYWKNKNDEARKKRDALPPEAPVDFLSTD